MTCSPHDNHDHLPMKIDIRHLAYSYDGETAVFADFNWQAVAGQSWAVIGPSGCGKSTLLYLLAGLIHPVEGTVAVDGLPLQRPRPKTGLVLQDHGLMPWATVADNARLGLKIWRFYGPDDRHAPADVRLDPDQAEETVQYWLTRLGIADLQHKFPAHLSRGQRQRTAIARTLVLKPDLLLLDEPFSALDAPTRDDLRRVMADLRTEWGLTRIIVTHDIEEAVLMGEHILALTGNGNHHPQIIENPGVWEPGYRAQPAFTDQCDRLRTLLGELI